MPTRSDADKGKFAFLAQKMSDIAAHNIKALARGKPLPAKYSKLQAGSMIFVPVGSVLWNGARMSRAS